MVEASGKPWIVITDQTDTPLLMMDADGFLRHSLFHPQRTKPINFCHRPIIVHDGSEPLGNVMLQFQFDPKVTEDQIISNDVVLLWSDAPRVITGADILGRLVKGIVKRAPRTET